MWRICKLIDRGLYDTVILPDRWGCGASSGWNWEPTSGDQAQDMQVLFDALGVEGPLDVLGLSTGGPIALTLAHLGLDLITGTFLWILGTYD